LKPQLQHTIEMKEKKYIIDQNELNSPTTVKKEVTRINPFEVKLDEATRFNPFEIVDAKKEVTRINPFEVKINEVTRVNPFEIVDGTLSISSKLLSLTATEVESKIIERDEEARAEASINEEENRYDDTILDKFAIDIEDEATEVELGYDVNIAIEKKDFTSPETKHNAEVGENETSAEIFYDDARDDDMQLDEQVYFTHKYPEETIMKDGNEESLDIEEKIKLAEQNGSTNMKVYEEVDAFLNSSEIEEQIKIAKQSIADHGYSMELKVNTQLEIIEMNSSDLEEQIELAHQNLRSFGSGSDLNYTSNVELQNDVLKSESFVVESAKKAGIRH